MVSKARADQVAGGVFLIGLAILFMTGFWWPGILLVIGASSIARGVAEGRDWYSVPGGLWMIGLGLMFVFGFQWPLLLILIGVSMLFGKSWHGHHWRGQDDEPEIKSKRKNEDAYIFDTSEIDGDEVTVEDSLEKHKPRNV